MEKIIRSSKDRLLYLMTAAVMVSAILLLCAGTGALHSGKAARQVLLTFDDGPDPRYTPQILAILKEHNIRALFSVVGGKEEEHGDILKQIVLEGHSIGSHGYSHKNIDTLTPEQLREEVRLTDAAVLKATGLSPACFVRREGDITGKTAMCSGRRERKLCYGVPGWKRRACMILPRW